MPSSSAGSPGEVSRTNSAVVKSAELSTWNQWATLHQRADPSYSPVALQKNHDRNQPRIKHQDPGPGRTGLVDFDAYRQTAQTNLNPAFNRRHLINRSFSLSNQLSVIVINDPDDMGNRTNQIPISDVSELAAWCPYPYETHSSYRPLEPVTGPESLVPPNSSRED